MLPGTDAMRTHSKFSMIDKTSFAFIFDLPMPNLLAAFTRTYHPAKSGFTRATI
jgi:hypothetical protein